ncbi:MAG: YceI family protein [Deltaproteobacteria bacterium]|nr:YceI family protein [Deltaproteobacteria bacterium]NND28602.1 YceI family protein [Myxococcales bacterium]MBT8463222.1 YceI family protein [Deltaproteobacteria bacterium]MBT8481360.1 YceI family protein [Deltaproteobacteria bacterium]NNK06978.1 YceI family protein [Myxococcales bacterium]
MRTTSLLLTGLLIVGCKNPGAEVAPAKVEAAPGTKAEAAPSGEPDDGRAGSLAINPSNSKIEFVGAKVTASHDGGFTDFSGRVELGEPVEASVIELTIQTNSLFADKEKLTKHLKSPDFFDVTKFPTATFRSTEIKKDGEGHTISGDLTLHGVTKRISFPATVTVTESEVNANAEFSINRQDFGIAYAGMKDDLIRDLVVIKLSLELPRKS